MSKQAALEKQASIGKRLHWAGRRGPAAVASGTPPSFLLAALLRLANSSHICPPPAPHLTGGRGVQGARRHAAALRARGSGPAGAVRGGCCTRRGLCVCTLQERTHLHTPRVAEMSVRSKRARGIGVLASGQQAAVFRHTDGLHWKQVTSAASQPARRGSHVHECAAPACTHFSV